MNSRSNNSFRSEIRGSVEIVMFVECVYQGIDGNPQHLGDRSIEAKIFSGTLDGPAERFVDMVVLNCQGEPGLRAGLKIRRRPNLVKSGQDSPSGIAP